MVTPWVAAQVTVLVLASGGGRLVPAPLNICVDNTAAPRREMISAEASAAAMLAVAGIQARWTHSPPECLEAPIRIRVVDWLVNRPPYELAFGKPFAIGAKPIWVEYDHVKRTAANVRGVEPALLAHILVHEIVHVLGGDVGHSRTGVMKAHWSKTDCEEMLRRPLPLTSWDAILARAGAERLASASASP